MRRSIATVTLSGTLTEKLEAIARARFDGVEIFENDLLFHLGPPREIREICNDLNLTVDLYQPFRDFETKDHKQFLSNLERAERKFDVMQELGAPLVLVCSNVTDLAPDDAQTAEQLHALGERAAKRNLKIGYEALSWGKTIYRFDQAYKAVIAANHPHVGLIVDSFHTLALPDDWSGLDQIKGDKIFFVQLADAPRLGMNPLPLSRHHRVLPGQGDFDVAGFMEKVLKTGYNGIISLEIFNDDFRSAPARDTATDAMRSLLLLEEEVRLRATTPFKRTTLFTPPVTPEISRISFAEFAVDNASNKALGDFITPFGFEKLGTHKSKDVSLWGAGSARFILNKEPDSFAASYHLMHGTSVCAIAVECDDALGAAARAESFHLNRYEGRIGPNEHSIPAVRANDGSLIYFTDNDETKTAQFESDFNVNAAQSPIKYGDIDHIAYALPEGSMESRLLFYRLLLCLKAEDMHALADPLGLTFSRTVSNTNRTIRLPLNVSESRKTATARSLDAFMGAGVTHIAIKTDDIFTIARALLKNKAQVLPIADNYYDDLAARYQLDDALVDEMKELHILYDKDAKGEFFHLYSVPFENRFFIEIVQRQKGYDGYGVANAPHRLASLHRYRHMSKVLQD
jgi:4-hydroxyphenylpyruvate dioxygenase